MSPYEEQAVEVRVRSQQDDLLPLYATDGAAGADIRADIKEPIEMDPGQILLVPTGLYLEIPPGYEVQVRPRSGLAAKYGVTVLNAPGTIDSDYRGEVKVILINHGHSTFVIEPKMRIAQLILSPVTRARFVSQMELATSSRGEGGFGHTGVA